VNLKFDENISIKSILEVLKTEGVKTADVAKQIEGISEKPLRIALKAAGYEFRNKAPRGWHYFGESPEPLNASIFEYVKQSNIKVNRTSQDVIKSNSKVNNSNPPMNKGNTEMNKTSQNVIQSNTEMNSSNPPMNKGNTEVNKTSQNIIQSNSEMNSSNPPMNSNNTDLLEVSPVIHPQFTRDEIADIIEMLQEWRMEKKAEQLGFEQEPTQVHERIKVLPQEEKTRKTIVIDKNIGDRLDQYCKNEKVNKSDILHLALLDFLNKYESQ